MQWGLYYQIISKSQRGHVNILILLKVKITDKNNKKQKQNKTKTNKQKYSIKNKFWNWMHCFQESRAGGL